MRILVCFGAIAVSAGLVAISLFMWNHEHPNVAIAALMSAMASVIGALWQYNAARFQHASLS